MVSDECFPPFLSAKANSFFRLGKGFRRKPDDEITSRLREQPNTELGVTSVVEDMHGGLFWCTRLLAWALIVFSCVSAVKPQTNLVFRRSQVVGEPRAFLGKPRNAGI
jgi:hypothetical protein